MYAACLPSRIPFSCVHAGGQLRFVAKNTNTQNSHSGSNHALRKGNQPSPFPGGVQCFVCVLHFALAKQVKYLGMVHPCPGTGTGVGRNVCLSFVKAGGHCCVLREVTTVEFGAL